jgi:biopolymer transport protein ExbD
MRLNMTAMIDIVFQLLVFFVLTFKVTAMEADFQVKMPAASSAPDDPTQVLPTVIRVNLRAGGDRNIAGIDVDTDLESQSFDDAQMFVKLTEFVERVVTTEGDPLAGREVEVEFSIAESLRYKHTVHAIEAVSGKILPDRSIKTLVEKIKFRNPN